MTPGMQIGQMSVFNSFAVSPLSHYCCWPLNWNNKPYNLTSTRKNTNRTEIYPNNYMLCWLHVSIKKKLKSQHTWKSTKKKTSTRNVSTWKQQLALQPQHFFVSLLDNILVIFDVLMSHSCTDCISFTCNVNKTQATMSTHWKKNFCHTFAHFSSICPLFVQTYSAFFFMVINILIYFVLFS